LIPSQLSAGDRQTVDIYYHNDETQIRLLVTTTWLAARFLRVTGELKDKYGDERRSEIVTSTADLDIEDLIFSQKMAALRPVADEVGRATRIDDAKGRYIVFLKNTFPAKYTLDDFHIVLDCAHGATYKVAPFVFSELGAKVTCIGVNPDGKNINRDCGALHPEVMAEKVKQLGADIGLALDGDGDRLIVCDENGEIVDGDHIMAICAADLLSRRKLKKKTLVATVMSNMGLEKAMKKMKIM